MVSVWLVCVCVTRFWWWALTELFRNCLRDSYWEKCLMKINLCNKMPHWPATCLCSASGSDGNAAPWTTEEQKLLEQALKTYPVSTPERWEKIAAAVPGRSKKDCMKRYKVRWCAALLLESERAVNVSCENYPSIYTLMKLFQTIKEGCTLYWGVSVILFWYI